MKYRKLKINKYFYKLYIYDSLEELQAKYGKVKGLCIHNKNPKNWMGDIIVSKDQPSAITVHELYHATSWLEKHKRKIIPFKYDNHKRCVGKEEWIALVIETLWEQVLAQPPTEAWR